VAWGKRQQSAAGSQKSSPISHCPRADASRDYCCTQGGEVSPQVAALTVTGVAAFRLAPLAMNLIQAGIKYLLSDVAKLTEICWMCTAFQ